MGESPASFCSGWRGSRYSKQMGETMTRQLFAVFAFSALAASSGCSSTSAFDYQYGTPITDQQLAALVEGRSTSDDVFKAVGKPDKKGQLSGRTFWSYHYIRSPALPFGGRKQYEQVVVFEFNKDGTLQKTRKKLIPDGDAS
jgi:outer membrane protein assembly factor BamE (lipoprotein component of BamABCDE complex)